MNSFPCPHHYYAYSTSKHQKNHVLRAEGQLIFGRVKNMRYDSNKWSWFTFGKVVRPDWELIPKRYLCRNYRAPQHIHHMRYFTYIVQIFGIASTR